MFYPSHVLVEADTVEYLRVNPTQDGVEWISIKDAWVREDAQFTLAQLADSARDHIADGAWLALRFNQIVYTDADLVHVQKMQETYRV